MYSRPNPFGRKPGFFQAVLLLLLALFLVSAPPAMAQVPKEVMDRILQADTKAGQEEVARDYALQSISQGSANLGVGTGGVEYLRNLYKGGNAFVPPAGSRLSSFNSSMTYFGVALATVQVATDLQAGNFGQAASNVVQSGLYTWAAVVGGPVGAVFFASDVVGRGFLYLADKAFSDDRWWPAYERYYLKDDGRLEASAWIKLFDRKDPELQNFKTHMAKIWEDDVYLSENAPAKLSKPDSAAVAKFREAYPIRFFKRHLEPELLKWAAQKAAADAEEQRKNAVQAMKDLIAGSFVEVEVVDDQTNKALKAWVKGTYLDGGSQAKETRDGIWTHLTHKLMGIPPWASGTILVSDCDGFESRNQNFQAQSGDDLKRGKARRVQVRLRPLTAALQVRLTGSLQVEYGDIITYKAAVNGGTGSYGFTWFIDGKQKSADDDTLSIKWARTGDRVVKVVTLDKKTKLRCEQSVTVTVTARPLSVKLEGPQQGRVGETSRYSVSIKGGVGSCALQWILDGAPQNVKDAAVTTTWAVPGNHVMEVVVTDDQKNTTSDRVTTDVAGINFDAKPPSGPGTASVGEQSIYRVTATGGTPPYTYRWMLNGNEMNLNDPAIALTWQNPGPWALAVTVSDRAGASKSFNQTVNVNPSGGNVNPPTGNTSPPFNTGGVRSAGSFAGEWIYSWVTSKGNGASAKLRLTVSGSSLVGTYTYGDPAATIRATLSNDGRTMEGTYREAHDFGTIRCNLSPDGNSFAGSWDASGPGGSGSTGTCSGSRRSR